MQGKGKAGLSREVFLIASHINDPLDNKPRTAEFFMGIFPYADNLWCHTAFGKLLVQSFFIEMLVESYCNNRGLDLLNRAEHVCFITKYRMRHGFKSRNHLESMLFRNDRTGFVPDICVPCNDYPEFVPEFF